MPDVVEATGLSSATINRLHRRNEFPAKRQLSERCVGWWEQDIAAWKASRPDVREK
ncbi:helix-turn-helix transcriptional regulator [Sphingomonas panacis]|nr:AlpA family phage regulatory protein [Sphingomonas panacis]